MDSIRYLCILRMLKNKIEIKVIDVILKIGFTVNRNGKIILKILLLIFFLTLFIYLNYALQK